MKDEKYYDPNNVNADNFNETMDGYVKYALESMSKALKENENFTDEQINTVTDCFKTGLRWSKDDLTMENARNYKNRRKQNE
jgi:hypothetical protein